jgi:predicted dehydrogenase
MSDLTLRWGVISTANIGRVAVNPAIQAASNGELLAVASRDSERARSFAEAHSIPRHYGSYQDLLVDADIDAVYNPLPNSLHLEWTVRAADAGKHILCEKPMALNERECREMAAAAAANDVELLEAFMYRFHPRTERVVEMVREGVIGELRAIRSAFTFRLTRPDNIRMDPELGGGALMDVGCYCVNVSRTLAGAEPDEVQATARWAASGVDEQLVGTLMFSDGVMAHFDCALTMERCESYEVAGTDGYLTVPESFLPGTNDARILEHRGRGEVVHHTIAGADEYQRMVEHFGDAVLHGRPLRYTPEEAAQNMRVIEALYRSARGRGRVVAIRD